jgi:chemotaxis family two-component system response regulator Rcp1
MSRSAPKPPSVNNLEILIIEDDATTAYLTKEAFRVAEMHHGLVSMPDGEEALAYLHRAGESLPDLICLDLHLPKVPGLQVLAELKSDPRLKRIPVIIVSGATDPREIREAYELHASCFIRKPNDLDEFLYFVRICFEFWGEVVTLAV